jgi:5-hydroxyisourate hydrolase
VSVRTTISTHVLDTALGKPAAGVVVTLLGGPNGTENKIASQVTDADGRVASFGGDVALEGGSYSLTFDVTGYFATTQRRAFYRTVRIDFEVGVEPQHYHVPLLLSPFGYSTYRGS